MCGGPPPYASSAMRPTAHTQQASSRAVATFCRGPRARAAPPASRQASARSWRHDDVEGDGLYRAGVDVEADEGGSIEHGSPFHECGVAATVGLDTHHCRPNPRSFMQQGLSMFLCPAHIVSAGSWGHSLAIDALERSDIQFFDSVCIYARYWVIKSKSEHSRSAMRLGQPGRFCGRG